MGTIKSHEELVRVARMTGVWYLSLGIAGLLGFMFIHPQIFIPDDPAKTLENLIQREAFARIRILLEFVLIVTQALAAVWFYRLFSKISEWSAWATGVWGMANSLIIIISAIAMGAALEVAGADGLVLEDKILSIRLLEQISRNAWSIGGLFFGLWLMPMGYAVVVSRRMPVWLGRTLLIGGVGYLLNTFINYGGYTNPLTGLLVIPATIGEFWMIGYLLIYGIRPVNSAIPTRAGSPSEIPVMKE